MLKILNSSEKFAYQIPVNYNNVAIGAQPYKNDKLPCFIFEYTGIETIFKFILYQIKISGNVFAVPDSDGSPIVVANYELDKNDIVKSGTKYYLPETATALGLNGFFYFRIQFTNNVYFNSEIFKFGTGQSYNNIYTPYISIDGNAYYVYSDKNTSFQQTFTENTYIEMFTILAKTTNCEYKIGTTLGGSEICTGTISSNNDYDIRKYMDRITAGTVIYFTRVSGTMSVRIDYQLSI